MSMVKTKWEDDEFLIDEEFEEETEELDEDEAYVKETSTGESEDVDDDEDSYDPYEEDYE